MKIVLIVIAIVLFILQAASLHFGQFQPGWVGLAFLAGALLMPPAQIT
jgi:hypothetical protein